MVFFFEDLEQMAQSALLQGEDYDPNAAREQQHQGQSISARYYKPTDSYYVLLGGKLDTPSKVQELGRLPRVPECVRDEAGSDTRFCLINGSARSLIEQELQGCDRPIFIVVTKSREELSEHTWAPYLGRDYSLPQNRLPSESSVPQPSMSQFPVWYFVYGSLRSTQQLSRLIGRPSGLYEHIPAEVIGGKVRVCAGQTGHYNALVDSPGAMAPGFAFRVADEDEEDALRVHEAGAYEVVRCRISIQNIGMVHGLCFKFVGGADKLL